MVMKILIKVAILLIVVLGAGAFYGWLQWKPIAAELSAKNPEKFDLMVAEAKSFGFGTAQKLYDELNAMTPEDVVFLRHSKWEERLATDEEFRNSKDSILKGIPAQYATQRQIMGQILELASFNLPDNYFETRVKTIRDLAISDIHGIAKRGIESDNLTIVVVGDQTNIQPDLLQLGLPIEEIDINCYLI